MRLFAALAVPMSLCNPGNDEPSTRPIDDSTAPLGNLAAWVGRCDDEFWLGFHPTVDVRIDEMTIKDDNADILISESYASGLSFEEGRNTAYGLSALENDAPSEVFVAGIFGAGPSLYATIPVNLQLPPASDRFLFQGENSTQLKVKPQFDGNLHEVRLYDADGCLARRTSLDQDLVAGQTATIALSDLPTSDRVVLLATDADGDQVYDKLSLP